jgi:hypothetical protein
MLRYKIRANKKEESKEYTSFLRLNGVFAPKLNKKPHFCLYSPVDYNMRIDSIIIGSKEKVQSNPRFKRKCSLIGN